MFPAPIENQALERQKTPLHSPDDPTGVRPLPEIAREPVFGPPPPLAFARRDPEVFVSYAWADDTPEGQTRGKLVDDLCAALDGVIKVRRDRDEMRPGALISEFMTRLTEADFVILVISNKYLRSEYCMYELFRLWRSSADRPQVFLRRVVPLILPDANLGDVTNRFQRAIYWREQVAALEPLIANNLGAVGSEVFRKFTLMSEFARNTSDILEHLVDKLMPRDFERMAAEGFREIVDLVRRRD
jgi:internalin A